MEESVQIGVHGADAVEVGAGEILRSGLAGGERSGLGGRAAADGVVHAHSSPRICGTANRPSSASCAPESACSCVSVWPTTCSRNNLVLGIGWVYVVTYTVAHSEMDYIA